MREPLRRRGALARLHGGRNGPGVAPRVRVGGEPLAHREGVVADLTCSRPSGRRTRLERANPKASRVPALFPSLRFVVLGQADRLVVVSWIELGPVCAPSGVFEHAVDLADT